MTFWNGISVSSDFSVKLEVMKWRIVLLLFLLVFGFWRVKPVLAEEDCLSNPKDWPPLKLETCLTELAHLKALSEAATAPLESEIKNLGNRINALQAGINAAVAKQKKLEMEVADREEKVAEHYVLFGKKIRELYKSMRGSSLLVQLLSRVGAGRINREIEYQGTASDVDKQLIVGLSGEILSLETTKKNLEAQKIKLASLQETLNKQAEFYKGEVAKAKSYQQVLSSKIAQISAKQREILGQKLAGLNLPTSLGAGPLYCTDDRKLDPGFSPAYAFFTFGIPHRVGLDQYGAYGRAKVGQNYDQILRAYFNFDEFRDGVNATIKVNNSNGFDQGNIIWTGGLEDYVKRIYEMPGDWPSSALEAQAIAVRSYVLAATDNGNKSICANQYCQVFKTDPKGGAWEQAATSTAGKVMVSGGQIITAWYASTFGGYTFTNTDVWGGSQRSWTKRARDTDGEVTSFSDLMSKAYDKDSPCAYAAQGWRNQYGKSAWLRSEEVADIANVILLVRKDSSTRSHIYQPDKNNPEGTDTWDAGRVKQELKNRGIAAFESVSNVLISGVDWGTGLTTGINIIGNISENFDGREFKDFFNLRAPANIQIVGGLFNIEKK